VEGVQDDQESADGSEVRVSRFGSPVGWVFVVAIFLILGFAVFFDVRPGHAIDRLRPGMSPTEVAAILGAARSELRSGKRLVQSWRLPQGTSLEVEYEDGRLVTTRQPQR
jgi:hypothetical protein